MKRILIVVDVQNGFARTPDTKKVSLKIEELLCRKLFDVVIATKYVNGSNSIYERLFNWNGLVDAEQQKLAGNIEEYVDCVVKKTIYNCVDVSFIQKLCQMNDGEYPTEVYVVGIDTDCCVLTVATSLFEHNIRPIVLLNYCYSNGGDNSHQAGILCMRRLIGDKQLVHLELKEIEDFDKI